MRGAGIGFVAAVLLASACGRVEAPARAPQGAACALRGKVTVHRRIPVHARASGGAAHATVLGQLGIEVQRIAPSGDEARALVSIRSEPTGPAFHVDGFVDAGELALYTTREIAVVPGHVIIKRGAAVEALGAPGAAVAEGARIGAVGHACATVDTRRVQADVSCGDLTFEPAREREARRVGQSAITFAGAKIPLLAAPDGPPVLELASRHGSITFDLLETKGATRHVRYEDDIVIDGWIAAPPRAGVEGDHDSCDSIRDADDLCPDSPDEHCADPEGAQRRRASADAIVRASPSGSGTPLGRVDRGAELYVIEERGDWVSVVPIVRTSAISPPSPGGAFWIPRAAL